VVVGLLILVFKPTTTAPTKQIANPVDVAHDPNYLPDGWDFGHLEQGKAPLYNSQGIILGEIPVGTMLFYYRYGKSLRKVIALDGSWKGYACINTTEPYKPVPIQKGWERAVKEMSSPW
jgi:hypothetical protein